MSLLESIGEFLRRERCRLMVSYQRRTITFEGLEGKARGVQISFGGMSSGVRKMEQASEMAKVLDQYQFITCRFIRSLPSNDPRKAPYQESRWATIALITKVQIAMLAYKESQGQQQGKLLDSAIEKMVEFDTGVIKPLRPRVRKVREPEKIGRGVRAARKTGEKGREVLVYTPPKPYDASWTAEDGESAKRLAEQRTQIAKALKYAGLKFDDVKRLVKGDKK